MREDLSGSRVKRVKKIINTRVKHREKKIARKPSPGEIS
jgi:hypothetical protein